jgi:NAD(P)-dependent dehydrogenase (short-subunit alcohol dehydrogenase family)
MSDGSILITGASTGIGEACALHFDRLGWQVFAGGPVEYVPLSEVRRQFEVNVIGQIAVTQGVLPLIRRSGARGRIVFMGSIGGRMASPLIAPYSASKHAIEAIAESMRHELASTRISPPANPNYHPADGGAVLHLVQSLG